MDVLEEECSRFLQSCSIPLEHTYPRRPEY